MVTIVNHIYAAPGRGWQAIWLEQLSYIRRYDLPVHNWYCNVAGTRADAKAVASIAGKHGLTFTGLSRSHPSAYEIPAIRLVQEHSKDKVLYFHSKGVSMPMEITRMKHRWLMQAFVLAKWRDCVADLDSHDIAGVNWRSDLPEIPHFSGTFWWATQSWISKLPDIDDFCRSFGTLPHLMPHHPRCAAEFWIGSGSGQPNVKSYYCEGVEFGHQDAEYLRTLPASVALPAEIQADVDAAMRELGSIEEHSLSRTLKSMILAAMPGGMRHQLSSIRRKISEMRHLP